MKKNIVTHDYRVTKIDRQKLNQHSSLLIFFTGLSGSGKSTIANALEHRLHVEGIKTYVLDGDNVRRGINKNLGFSPEDRSENNRRIGEIAHLFVDAGLVVLAAFVAPYAKDRERIKKTVGAENFIEIYVDTPLSVCEERDVKGLYKKARNGEIPNMTGISAPYEAPTDPDLNINHELSIEESVSKIFQYVLDKIKFKA